MLNKRKKLNQIKKGFYLIRQTVRDEKGSLQDLTWVVGAAVVVALIIIGAMTYAPQTASAFWTQATGWIKTSFGF